MKITPRPYRDRFDHPYCTTECPAWRARPDEMPDHCIVRGATPSLLKNLGHRMCLPIIDQLCRASAKETK